MRVSFARSVFAALFITVLASASALAQGSFFSSLTGTVVDSSGLVIPGADVKIKNNGTGIEYSAVTGSDGGFSVPSIPAGSYSVTVSLMGFKTVNLANVTVQAAIPASVKVSLQVGALEENITVTGESASIVQTATPAIATNMTSKQILSLPLTSRNALDSITSLPGFNTAGAARGSTVSGLPRGSLNITLDGMSVQDNFLKDTDGYFARLSPRLDAVEEVTVTTAGGTADSTMGGSAQIKFVTRSGSNRLSGSAYEYYRNDALNANTWFNNRDTFDPATGKATKAEINQKQIGGRVGGAIVIPGIFDGHDKAFFFFNYEQLNSPGNSTLNRTVLSPSALNGDFSYVVGGQTRSVNLFQLAAANGQTATADPRIMSVLNAIRSATAAEGTLSNQDNPIAQRYTFVTPTTNFNPYPTGRVDFNLSANHRLTGSFNYQHINSTPDTTNSAQVRFPGFSNTGSQQSTRWTTSESLRSTLGRNMVNEFRIGATGGATLFSPEIEGSMFTGATPDLFGLALNIGANSLGTGATLTNPYTSLNNSSREASTWVLEDTMNWLKGKHTFTMGMNFLEANVWLQNQQYAPDVRFDVVVGDPAEPMFVVGNFSGAASADLTNARRLYALLTGRVSSVGAEARINEAGDQYVTFGQSRAAGRQREFDFFMSDSWRLKPSVTLTYGLRYALQLPFYPTNSSYTKVGYEGLWGSSGVDNMFKPGATGGTKTAYSQYPKGEYAYKKDLNNIAPAIGATWSIPQQEGFLGRMFGSEGDTVIRGAYSLSYERLGSTRFTTPFGGNQGIVISATRDVNSGTLGPLPQLLRNPGSTALPPISSTPSFPIASNVSNSVNAFDPDFEIPYAQTWSAGIQRKVTRNSAIEARYVGSRHYKGVLVYNLNEFNIVENNFLNEFRLAQGNLAANIAAGRGNSFAFTGIPGTAPLPTYVAYFSGVNAAGAADPARYTSTNFTNSTFVNLLAKFAPNPFAAASALQGNAAQRTNAINAGLPANHFLVNPDVNAANMHGNYDGADTTANSFQLEYRKRLSNGLAYSTSYTFSKSFEATRYSFRNPLVNVLQVGTDGDVRHAAKGNWVMELPFGRDRKWGSNASSVMNALIGGWEFDGVGRVQTGQNLNFGNVRLVGMTKDEFRDSINMRLGPVDTDGKRQLYLLPEDIITNTIRAFNVSATDPTGYSGGQVPTGRFLAPQNGPDCIEIANGTGAPSATVTNLVNGIGACGVNNLIITGPNLITFDLSFVKRFNIVGRTNAEFRGELLNAFNRPYFEPRNAIGVNDSSYRLDTQSNDPRVIQLVFRLNF